MSVIRIKHNRENPYVQINKEALWNPKLSLKAIGLWAKCLSRPDDWIFHVKELASRGKDKKRSIYSTIAELEKEKYVLKLKHYEKKDNGAFENGGVEYIFFEVPYTDQERDSCIEEFKKSFRHCSFGNPRDRGLHKSTLLKTNSTDSSSSFHSEEEKKYTKPTSSPPPEAQEVSSLLIQAIKTIKPDFKEPKNIKTWDLEMDRMIRIDKRSLEKIKEVLKWLPTSSFWSRVILSADKFRVQFDRLELAMSEIPPRTSLNDQGLIESLKTCKDSIRHGDIILGHDYVEFPRIHGENHFKAGQPGFKEIIENILKKMGVAPPWKKKE